MKKIWVLLAGLALATSAAAQHYQSDFGPADFHDRWNAIFDAIGNEAIAIIQGGPSARGFEFPRQTNNFYYLTGIETPHAWLMLDGRTREVTAFLPPRNEKLEKSEGRILSASDVELIGELTGIHHVAETSTMQGDWLNETLGDPRAVI